MFDNLDVFKLSHTMARHAGTRQALVSQNMANADTPGYTARDVKPFAAHVTGDGAFTARATRPNHLFGQTPGRNFDIVTDRTAPRDPNGNSVSLETEMLRGVETRRQHDRALAIYRSGLTVLRTALGRN